MQAILHMHACAKVGPCCLIQTNQICLHNCTCVNIEMNEIDSAFSWVQKTSNLQNNRKSDQQNKIKLGDIKLKLTIILLELGLIFSHHKTSWGELSWFICNYQAHRSNFTFDCRTLSNWNTLSHWWRIPNWKEWRSSRSMGLILYTLQVIPLLSTNGIF